MVAYQVYGRFAGASAVRVVAGDDPLRFVVHDDGTPLVEGDPRMAGLERIRRYARRPAARSP